ncbi:MAG TPA: diacylglycerol kinase family protein [Gemmatimonadota bacterium]|nr:diacylglycerol kinase family protein [Gemmatimonadota bacterium]
MRPSDFPYPVGERFLVLVNPRASGAGGGAALRRRIAGAFAGHGVPFDILEVEDPAGIREAARRGAEMGFRAVVAVGGDGTVAQALRGTAGSEVPVAVLPFGTGNQLALNFGIPTSLEGSVRTAVQGTCEAIDLGRLDGEHFALIAGAGLDADVMADATSELKSRLGFAAYLVSGLKNVITPRAADFRIEADGREIEVKASMVLLANVGQLVAAGLPVEVTVAPRASFKDGLLDVCIYAPRNLPEMAGMLWQVAREKYAGNERMLFLQARSVRVESDPAVAVQVDGEPFGETPITADVEPLAGRILVPSR